MTTLTPAVDDPGRERVGGEPPEDHRVRRADPGAGQHRDNRLEDHRHVDRDPVALAHTEVGQRVRRLADLVLELGVRHGAGVVLRLTHPVDSDPVTQPVGHVPVHAVVRRVEAAPHEPLRERRVVPVEHAVPLLVPVEALGLLGPERLGVGLGPGVRLLLEVGVPGQIGRRREPALLSRQVRQGLFAHELLLDLRPEPGQHASTIPRQGCRGVAHRQPTAMHPW